MKVFNGTAHTINFYNLEQCDQTNPRKLIVLPGQEPAYVIPGGTNLNAQTQNKPAPRGDFPFPVIGGVEFTSVDELPEGYDVYIVSQMFRSAMIALGIPTDNIATVNGVVYTDPENPRPCGCLSLAIG